MIDLSKPSRIDNAKCLFYVRRRRKWKKEVEVSGPWDLATALRSACVNICAHKVIVIDRDSCGQDHPDNAGKAFTYQIIK